jgi:hypothetical protein
MTIKTKKPTSWENFTSVTGSLGINKALSEINTLKLGVKALGVGAKYLFTDSYNIERNELIKKRGYYSKLYTHNKLAARKAYELAQEHAQTKIIMNEFSKDFERDEATMLGYASGIDVNQSVSYQRAIQKQLIKYSQQEMEIKNQVRQAHEQYLNDKKSIELEESNLSTESEIGKTMNNKWTAELIDDIVGIFK